MDMIIEIIKKYREILNHNKELEKTKISILKKIKDGDNLDSDELRTLKNVLDEIPTARNDKKIPYILKVLECGSKTPLIDNNGNQIFRLDIGQREKIVKYLTLSNSKYETMITQLDEIVENINKGVHLNSEQLTIIQGILFDNVNEMDLSDDKKIEFVKAIIEYNASITTSKENKVEEIISIQQDANIKPIAGYDNSEASGSAIVSSSKESTQEIIVEARKNTELVSDEELAALLKEFKYNYDKLAAEFKMYLRQYVKIDKLRDLLTVLDSYSIRLFTSANLGRMRIYQTKLQDVLFTRILCYSSPELVEQIKADFDDETAFRKFVVEHPSMLIPKIIGSNVEEPESGYYNYIKNKEFFASKGFDFNTVTATASSILTHNPSVVVANYHIITDKYKISFTDDSPSKKKTTGLYLLARSINTYLETVDWLIEADPAGYQYISEHPTKISAFAKSEGNIRRIKLAYLMGKTLLKTRGKMGLCFSEKNNEDGLQDLFEDSSHNLVFGYTLGKSIVSKSIYDTLEPYVTNREAIFADINNTGLVTSNKLFDYLEANCKESDFLYSIPSVKPNGRDTLISRQKVIRVLNILSTIPDLPFSEVDIAKFAISFKSFLANDDQKNLEAVINKVYFGSIKMGGV